MLIPGMSTILRKSHPQPGDTHTATNRLCRKDTPWRWGTEEQDVIQRLKDALCTDEVL